jgi:hypothetical protein
MKDRTRNILTGGLTLVLGLTIYIFIIPWQLEITTFEGSITPALFPKIATGAIILLSVILLANELLSGKKLASAESTPLSWSQRGRVLAGFGMAAGYVVLMNYLGFIIATPIYLLLFMYFLGGRNWWAMVAVGLIVTGIIYWSFGKVMMVPLPTFTLFS